MYVGISPIYEEIWLKMMTMAEWNDVKMDSFNNKIMTNWRLNTCTLFIEAPIWIFVSHILPSSHMWTSRQRSRENHSSFVHSNSNTFSDQTKANLAKNKHGFCSEQAKLSS